MARIGKTFREVAVHLSLFPGFVLSAFAQGSDECTWNSLAQNLPTKVDHALVQSLRRCAERGDPQAILGLADLYRTGAGVEPDETEAAWWYRKAAELGMPEAEFQIGVMYLEGIGVTQDSEQAMHWLSEASRHGHPDARAVFQYVLENGEALDC